MLEFGHEFMYFVEVSVKNSYIKTFIYSNIYLFLIIKEQLKPICTCSAFYYSITFLLFSDFRAEDIKKPYFSLMTELELNFGTHLNPDCLLTWVSPTSRPNFAATSSIFLHYLSMLEIFGSKIDKQVKCSYCS